MIHIGDLRAAEDDNTKEKHRQNCLLPHFSSFQSAFSGGCLESGCWGKSALVQLNRAAHGWSSFQSSRSHKQPGFDILPLWWCLTNDYLVQIESLNDFRKQGLRWPCHGFVYLQALCFCCHRNHAWRAPLKAYRGAYIYFEVDEDVMQMFSWGCDLPILLWDCLADGSGDTDDSCQGQRKVLRCCHERDPGCYCMLTWTCVFSLSILHEEIVLTG